MSAWLDDGDVQLYHGDCREVMAGLAEGSIDAVVCDPPYGLGFMGKDWDSPGGTGDFPMRRTTPANTVNTGVSRQGGRQRSCEDFAKRQARDARSFQEWSESWAVEALRVLKPGGHLLAFGGTRTYHRLACALEDAGFEIRDCLCWLFGSGFPKSLDVSKAIDKAAGAEREVLGLNRYDARRSGTDLGRMNDDAWEPRARVDTSPATPDAVQWQGWGTALKPAYEPIILARKPLVGTVASNVLAHGTGALNIDACRVNPGELVRGGGNGEAHNGGRFGAHETAGSRPLVDAHSAGRWPANVALDEVAAAMLDEQSGERAAPQSYVRSVDARSDSWFGSGFGGDREGETATNYGDRGGASRFFYTAKASRSERNEGLGAMPTAESKRMNDRGPGGTASPNGQTTLAEQNHHPTVKPVALMRWLCRLATPTGGLILDPFLGSGTTAVAARLEGFRCIGIEQDAEYLAIASARLGQQSLFAPVVVSREAQ